jgi:hypothetical protein
LVEGGDPSVEVREAVNEEDAITSRKKAFHMKL